MKRFFWGLLVYFGFLMAGPTLAQDQIQQMMDRLNEERYAAGLGQLYLHPNLESAAFAHARDMAERNYMSHNTPEGWNPEFRIRGWGYQGAFGENLFGWQLDVDTVVRGWMNSPGHRQNILQENFNAFGVGHWYTDHGGDRWVLILGRH